MFYCKTMTAALHRTANMLASHLNCWSVTRIYWYWVNWSISIGFYELWTMIGDWWVHKFYVLLQLTCYLCLCRTFNQFRRDGTLAVEQTAGLLDREGVGPPHPAQWVAASSAGEAARRWWRSNGDYSCFRKTNVLTLILTLYLPTTERVLVTIESIIINRSITVAVMTFRCLNSLAVAVFQTLLRIVLFQIFWFIADVVMSIPFSVTFIFTSYIYYASVVILSCDQLYRPNQYMELFRCDVAL